MSRTYRKNADQNSTRKSATRFRQRAARTQYADKDMRYELI